MIIPTISGQAAATTTARTTALAAVLASALLLCGNAAWAQEATAPGVAPQEGALQMQLAQLQRAQTEMEHQVLINAQPEALLMPEGALGPQRVVKGAPYCADAVHETVQWLSDGSGAAPNRIVRQQTSRLCRDGEGRTRQEIDRAGRKVVYLRDPVLRESWVLDPERKTARRLATGHDATSGMSGMSGFDAPAMREFSERMREWARGFADDSRSSTGAPPAPPLPPLPPVAPAAAPAPAPVLITRSGDAKARTEVRILHLGPDADRQDWDWALPPPPVQWRANHLAPRGAGSVTPLPGKDVEGLRANGERTTWVIAAGQVGNEKPIQITHEVWTSPELMLTVNSRDFDPRSGEVSYRLKSVKRGEPDAALMRVPPDYKQPGRPANKASSPTG